MADIYNNIIADFKILTDLSSITSIESSIKAIKGQLDTTKNSITGESLGLSDANSKLVELRNNLEQARARVKKIGSLGGVTIDEEAIVAKTNEKYQAQKAIVNDIKAQIGAKQNYMKALQNELNMHSTKLKEMQSLEKLKTTEINKEMVARTKIGDILDRQAIKEEQLAKTQQIKDFSKQGKMVSTEAIDTKNLEIAEDLMKRTGLEANALNIGLKRLGMTIKGGKIIGPFNKEIKATEINMKKLRAASVQFKMSLLSVMFAGMALQRATGKMLRSFVTTFQKANEDTEGLGKATWHLQAAWEFLKYSMIDALLQSDLFKLLVELALKLIMWLNKLPASAKAFIVIGIAVLFVLGTLMVLIGQIGLFINGMAAMGIGQGVIAALGAAFWWLALIVGVVILLWISDFGDFKDFVINTLGIMWETFKAVFGHLWQIVKDVLGIIVAIFQGDWEKVWELTKDLLKNLGALFFKVLIGIGMFSVNIFIWVWNMIVDLAFKILLGGIFFLVYKISDQFIKLKMVIVKAFSSAIDVVVNILNKLIDYWNRTVGELTGLTISPFKYASEQLEDLNSDLEKNKLMYDAVTKSIGGMANKLKASYFNAEDLKKEFGEVDDLFNLSKEISKEVSTKVDSTDLDKKIQEIMDNNKVVEAMNQLNESLKAKGLDPMNISQPSNKNIQVTTQVGDIQINSTQSATEIASQINELTNTITDSVLENLNQNFNRTNDSTL